MPRSTLLLALLALALALPAAAPAQEMVHVRETPAWLGIGYDVRWIQEDGRCEAQAVVESVVHGSPADRAGLRPGDAILALDGRPVPALELPRIAARLAPGDSLRLRIRRDGAVREVTAVADRRPDRPPALVVERRASGFRATSAPIVRITGDTLVAVNVRPSTGWRGDLSAGYWVTHQDGRTEYRRLSGWDRSELDARVADLLVCADTTRAPAPPAVARVDLRELQERADSLRVLLTRRALARRDRGEREGYRVEVRTEAQRAGPPDVRVPGPGAFIFRVEDHVATGLRGVAGAELTALEPELADYFRNVRSGLLVLRIAPGTPADRAGLRPGDVIVAAGGRPVDVVPALRALLTGPEPGPLDLRVVRKGRTLTASLRRD